MLIILLKLPRTEKYSIGTEIKTSMYNMLKNILLANKSDKIKRLPVSGKRKAVVTKTKKYDKNLAILCKISLARQ